jgi:hypothetical protein
MPIEYVNKKKQTYYLHQGTTKTGKPKYFFSMKTVGDLVDTLPDGYEIYENPNARVFLRRVQPKIITDEEIAIVEWGMEQFSDQKYYQIDVKKNIISIFIANQDVDTLAALLKHTHRRKGENVQDLIAQIITYFPMLRFVLIDKEQRIFMTQRFCFLDSLDDWIDVGKPGPLQKLVRIYVRHLGYDSFFELI